MSNLKYCAGCFHSFRKEDAALSRYGHGPICSACGIKEAFDGNFIDDNGDDYRAREEEKKLSEDNQPNSYGEKNL